MSLPRPDRSSTLVLQDREARLLDAQGEVLLVLPPLLDSPELRQEARAALAAHLRPGHPVDLVIASASLEVQCQEVPYLSPGEVREAGMRLVASAQGSEDCHAGAVLLADAEAEGGHVLWVAMAPKALLDPWLELLSRLGAALHVAVPHSFLMVKGLGTERPRDLLVLGIEGAAGRVGFLRGPSLLFTRTFWLPEGLDPDDPAHHEELLEVLAEELGRVLQFVKQKHRGVSLDTLRVLGLESLAPDALAALARTLRLKVEPVGESPRGFMAAALAQVREERDLLNLMPREILEARRIRTLRRAAWACAAAVATLGLLTWAGMGLAVRRMASEADRAEAAMAQRRTLLAEKDRVARIRFPLVRVRAAEARQAAAATQLEGLALRLLEVPVGVRLESVEITQMPGEPLRWRFQVVGTALTREAFSLGPVAQYLQGLKVHPGLELSPLRDITVSDREGLGTRETAVSRFAVEGVSP